MYLSSDCRFVEGATKAAIYDLRSEKIFSLNNSGRTIIRKVLSGVSSFGQEEKTFLNELKLLGLVSEVYDLPIESKVLPSLNYVWLEITDQCNQRCKHCYGDFGYNPHDSCNLLSIKEWKVILRYIKTVNCREVQFIGGEPLLFPGFEELLRYAHSIGIAQIDVFSNGSVINEKIIHALKETGANLRISLYGHNASIHDNITQREGSFSSLDTSLNLLIQNNIFPTIAVILMKENELYLEDIKKYIISKGLKYSGYDTIRKSSVGQQHTHFISSSELLEKRYLTTPEFSTSRYQYFKNLEWNSCWFGKVAICANGDVLPCIFARENKLGNINTDSLVNIKENAISAWSITKDQVEECKNCEFRYTCHDCRPLAQASGGSMFEKYPRCCYNPSNGIWCPIKTVTKELNIE